MNATTTITSAQARRLSEKWLTVLRELKELELQKQNIETELREYVRETGEETIGSVKAYTRSKPAKLECYATNKKLDDVVPFLLIRDDLADYVKRSLDVSGIARDYDKNAVLKAACAEWKVRPAQPESEIYFKHV